MPFRESVSSVDVANMFGMELGYPTFDKVKLEEISEVKIIDGREFEWIRLTDRGLEKSLRTILLALHRNEDETWLFPFIGDRDLINGQEKNLNLSLPRPPCVPAKLKLGPRHLLLLLHTISMILLPGKFRLIGYKLPLRPCVLPVTRSLTKW